MVEKLIMKHRTSPWCVVVALSLSLSGTFARGQSLAPPPPPMPGISERVPTAKAVTVHPLVPRGYGKTPFPRSLRQFRGQLCAADQVIIELKTSSDDAGKFLYQYGMKPLYISGDGSWILAELLLGLDIEYAENVLKFNDKVIRVTANSIVQSGGTPTDAEFVAGWQWNFTNISIFSAWDRTIGNSAFSLAVLDSGINTSHIDLSGQILRDANNNMVGFNHDTSVFSFEDDNYHGSFVSGIAAAQTSFVGNSFGMAGISPNARIVPVKIINSSGFGTYAQFIAGIDSAISVPSVRIINASVFGYDNEQGYTPGPMISSLKKAIGLDSNGLLQRQGILVVGITGNYSSISQNVANAPGNMYRVMAVGATSRQDVLAPYSITGMHTSVVAPSGTVGYPGFPADWIKSCGIGGPSSFTYGNGTSFAAPQVAGLAHLTLSRYSTMTWWDLKARIEDTATDLYSNSFDNLTGWGRINANEATLSQTNNVTNRVYPIENQPSFYQLVSIPMWPHDMPATDRSQDWSILFGNEITDPARGFDVLWYDPTSGQYRPYSDLRVPRIGGGRAYYARFSPLRVNGVIQQPPPGGWVSARPFGGAYPYRQSSHPVVTHLYAGGWNLIGTPKTGNYTWNADSIKIQRQKTDGTAEIVTLRQAKLNSQVEEWAFHFGYTDNSWKWTVLADTTTAPGTTFTTSGTTYSVERPMLPGEGYLIWSNIDCDLLFPN